MSDNVVPLSALICEIVLRSKENTRRETKMERSLQDTHENSHPANTLGDLTHPGAV